MFLLTIACFNLDIRFIFSGAFNIIRARARKSKKIAIFALVTLALIANETLHNRRSIYLYAVFWLHSRAYVAEDGGVGDAALPDCGGS